MIDLEKRRARHQRYNRSIKGAERNMRYEATDKAHARHLRYDQAGYDASPAGVARHERYKYSTKGLLTAIRSNASRRVDRREAGLERQEQWLAEEGWRW